jgi:hypothetical protein
MEREGAVMANWSGCDKLEDVARVGRINWRFNGGSALRRSGPSQGGSANGGGRRKDGSNATPRHVLAWPGPVTRLRAGPRCSVPGRFCSSAKRSSRFLG